MAVAVICEFNPFHNGHKYLINRVKTLTNEPVIAVMSITIMLIAFTLNSYFPTGRLLKETRELPLGKEFHVPLFMEYK